MIVIFKKMVNNVRVVTILGARNVFVKSCKQTLGSLTNLVATARAMNVIDHI